LDWKRAFKFANDEVLGLDIGSSQVKLIQMCKNGDGYVVTAAAAADIATGEGSDNHTEKKTVSAIRKCIESAGVRTRMTVCGVSGPDVAVRHFKFPSLPPDEVEGAISLEAAQVCPFNINDSAVDYQIIPGGEEGLRGVLVAATNRLIKTKRELAKKTSLKCVLMDVDGLALLNCFKGADAGEYEKQRDGRTTAILNVGKSYTTLVVIGDDGLPFIRDIAYAGHSIVEEIAAQSNVSEETVNRALSGYENAAEPEPEFVDGLERTCRKLIVDVTETLRYYAAQKKSAVVEKIFVCGGFALVKGFVELLDDGLPAKVVLWNPFDKIRCNAGRACEDILAKKGPAMAVAAGLAMRSF